MPYNENDNTRTFTINGDSLKFNHSVDDSVHIIAPSGNTLNFINDVVVEKSLLTDTIKNANGNELLSYETNKLVVKTPVDFNNVSVSNLNNLTLNSSQILSSNLSGQSGDTSIDAEIDSMINNIGQNTSRTTGLTANRIMRSNNAGTLQIATFDTTDVLRKNDTTDQAITSNLNFASGKKVLYNGNQVALSDISGYTTLQDEVDVNSAKTSITSTQSDAIIANSAKVGITTTQRDAIIANTAKVGITTTQRDDILANNNKVGITTTQRDAIIANTAKVALSSAEYSKIQALPAVADINAIAHTNDSGLTLFTNDLGCGSIQGSSAVLGSNGYLAINSTNDDSSISFDQDVGQGGFVLSNDSGDLAINTNIDLETGHKYKIDGSDLNFSDLAGTVADNQIVSSIARVTATNTLLDAKVNKSTPTFSGLSDGFCKIANNVLSGGNTIVDGDLPSTITRNTALGDYLKKDGSVAGTGTLTVPRLNLGDTSHYINKDGNDDLIFEVAGGDIHKFKIGSSTIASVDAGGIDLSSGKVFSIDGTTLTGITSSQSSAIVLNSAKTGITSSQATDITNSFKNTDNIQVPSNKHIYRATSSFVASSVISGSNGWITIAVVPSVSSVFGYSNSTFSILDSNRRCFAQFTVSIIKASYTINVDTYASSKSSGSNTGISNVRLRANGSYFDSSQRQGCLLQIFSKSTAANYTIYEHAGGNYIETGFDLVSPEEDSTSTSSFTKISDSSTITVSNVANYITVDEVDLDDFNKDYTLDHSDSQYEGDFLYRCGGNAYFKRRIVMESTAEDIYQTHANSSSLSNGVFTRLTAIENGKTYTANTIRLPNSNSRLSVQLNTTNACALAVGGGNTNCNVYQISSGNGTGDLSHYGFSCRYMGAGTGNNNSLRLIADNQGSTEKVSYEVLQDGKFIIHQEIYKTGSISSGDGLFERMSAIDSSPTWVAITPASGYETGATTDSTGRLEYAIVGGKQVFIRGNVTRTGNFDFTNNQVLFVLPSAIRPKYSFYAPLHPQLNAMLFFRGTNQDSTGVVLSSSGEDGSFNTHFTDINVNYLLD